MYVEDFPGVVCKICAHSDSNNKGDYLQYLSKNTGLDGKGQAYLKFHSDFMYGITQSTPFTDYWEYTDYVQYIVALTKQYKLLTDTPKDLDTFKEKLKLILITHAPAGAEEEDEKDEDEDEDDEEDEDEKEDAENDK
jgi:hypothetical protein